MNMLFNEVGRIVVGDYSFNHPPPRCIAAQSASWLGRYTRVRSTTSSTATRIHIGGTARHDGSRVDVRCATSASDSIGPGIGAKGSVPKQR